MSHLVLSSITRRLATTSLSSTVASASKSWINTVSSTLPSVSTATTTLQANNIRNFSSKKESIDGSTKTPNIQHAAWVKFQQSIAVDGFDTGATVTLNDASGGAKRRGGKALRKRMDKLRLQREESVSYAGKGGGQYPAEQVSEEETQKLLAEAYSMIPKRTGPRRSRHLKREFLRMEAKRQYAAKKKTERIATHHRRMAGRSRIAREVRDVRDVSEAVRNQDAQYQTIVLRRWAAMHLDLDVAKLGPKGHSNTLGLTART